MVLLLRHSDHPGSLGLLAKPKARSSLPTAFIRVHPVAFLLHAPGSPSPRRKPPPLPPPPPREPLPSPSKPGNPTKETRFSPGRWKIQPKRLDVPSPRLEIRQKRLDFLPGDGKSHQKDSTFLWNDWKFLENDGILTLWDGKSLPMVRLPGSAVGSPGSENQLRFPGSKQRPPGLDFDGIRTGVGALRKTGRPPRKLGGAVPALGHKTDQRQSPTSFIPPAPLIPFRLPQKNSPGMNGR